MVNANLMGPFDARAELVKNARDEVITANVRLAIGDEREQIARREEIHDEEGVCRSDEGLVESKDGWMGREKRVKGVLALLKFTLTRRQSYVGQNFDGWTRRTKTIGDRRKGRDMNENRKIKKSE